MKTTMRLINEQKAIPDGRWVDPCGRVKVHADPKGNIGFQVFNGWTFSSVMLSREASADLVDALAEELFDEDGNVKDVEEEECSG